MDRVLRLILVLSCILGCFPASILSKLRGQLGFRWLSCSVLYVVVIAILGLLLQLDVFYGFGNNDVYLNGTSKAFAINMTTYQIIELVHPLAVRLTGLVYCASVMKSVKSIGEIQCCTSQISSGKLAKLGPWCRQYKMCETVAYLCLLLVTIGQIRSHVAFVFSFLVPATWNGQLGTYLEAFLSPWRPLILFVTICGLHNGSVTVLMALWLTLGFGLMLVRAHGEFTYFVVCCLRDPTERFCNEIETTVLVFENFKKLKTAFGVCGEVMGLYILFTMGYILSWTVYSVHSLIWPLDGITGYVDLAHTMLCLVLFILLGHVMQNQVIKMADEIYEEMMAGKLRKDGSTPVGLQQAAEVVGKWKWELRAGGLFAVNNTCFAKLLGVLATSIIFLVQLQLSEATFQPKPIAA